MKWDDMPILLCSVRLAAWSWPIGRHFETSRLGWQFWIVQERRHSFVALFKSPPEKFLLRSRSVYLAKCIIHGGLNRSTDNIRSHHVQIGFLQVQKLIQVLLFSFAPLMKWESCRSWTINSSDKIVNFVEHLILKIYHSTYRIEEDA